MISVAEAKEKVDDGKWMRVWMAFDALAITPEAVKGALERHVNKLDSDSRGLLYKKEFSEPKKVDNPLKDIKEGYTFTANVEFVVKSFDFLSQLVIEYGPSALEILEPRKIEIPVGEAQAVLNTFAHMMHQFAAAGVGGMVIVRDEKQ